MRDTYVWKLPDDMPSEVAALLDPLAVAVRSVELAQTAPGIHEEAFHILKRHKKIPFLKLFTHTCKVEGVLDALKHMRDQDYMKELMKVD